MIKDLNTKAKKTVRLLEEHTGEKRHDKIDIGSNDFLDMTPQVQETEEK